VVSLDPLDASRALYTGGALATTPVQHFSPEPTVVKWKLDGRNWETEFPADINALPETLWQIYTLMGDRAVFALYFGLQTFRSAKDYALHSFGRENAVLLDPKGQVRAAADLAHAHALDRRFREAWDSIVDAEYTFLAWYEATLFEYAQAAAAARQKDFADWIARYGILAGGKDGALTAAMLEEVDAADIGFAEESNPATEALVDMTIELAVARFRDLEMRGLGRAAKDANQRASEQANIASWREKVAERFDVFRRLAIKAEGSHPLALAGYRDLAEQIFFAETPTAVVLRGKTGPDPKGDVRKAARTALLAGLVNAVRANRTALERFSSARAFGGGEGQIAPKQSKSGALVQSMAMQLSDFLLDRNAIAESLWASPPLHLALDRAARMENAINRSEQAASDLVKRLASPGREVLAQSAVPGSIAYRFRFSAVETVGTKAKAARDFKETVAFGAMIVGLGLAPFTGNTSLALAMAIDAAIAVSAAGEAGREYAARSTLSKLALTEVEAVYWTAPSLCELVAELAELLLRFAGDFVFAGPAARIIDILSVAVAIEQAADS
jgi:hypothetical protein